MAVLITIVVAAITYICWIAGLDTFRKQDLLFGFAALGLFQVLAIRQFLLGQRIFHSKIERFWYGTVLAKHKVNYPNKRVKSYHITVKVSDESVYTNCLKKTYDTAQPGQRVLVFSIGASKRYCVHPDGYRKKIISL